METLPARESAVDGCARAVRTAILNGELAPGTRLPPERSLSEQLGVSRLTLRAGLAKVAAAGLLVARQGSGYEVQDFRLHGGAELLPGLTALASQASRLDLIDDMLLVRRQLARATLERISQVADAGVVERVGAAVAALAAAVAAGADARAIAAADVGVVAAMLDETRSPVLRLSLNPIVSVLRELPELQRAMYADPRANLEAYGVLLGWLAERRREHIDVIIAELERRDQQTLARLGARPTQERTS